MQRNQKLKLPSVTLVSVSGINPKGNLRALEISQLGIDFGDALLLTRLKPQRSVRGIRVVPITNENWTYDEFSRFLLFEMYRYIHTEFAMFVHHRAHVLRPQAWSGEFLEYDYVGAPWDEKTHFTSEGVEVRVGNGGFSLRSQRLMRAPSELGLSFTDNGTGYFHEDGQLCVYHRHRLEQAGIRFAPVHLAARFATETLVRESVDKPFGFHNTRSAIPPFFYPLSYLKRAVLHARH
jgi:hypothetical protein